MCCLSYVHFRPRSWKRNSLCELSHPVVITDRHPPQPFLTMDGIDADKRPFWLCTRQMQFFCVSSKCFSPLTSFRLGTQVKTPPSDFPALLLPAGIIMGVVFDQIDDTFVSAKNSVLLWKHLSFSLPSGPTEKVRGPTKKKEKGCKRRRFALSIKARALTLFPRDVGHKDAVFHVVSSSLDPDFKAKTQPDRNSSCSSPMAVPSAQIWTVRSNIKPCGLTQLKLPSTGCFRILACFIPVTFPPNKRWPCEAHAGALAFQSQAVRPGDTASTASLPPPTRPDSRSRAPWPRDPAPSAVRF